MKQPKLDKGSFIPIYHQLFKHFEGLILSGELVPGDMLPTEMEFSEQLGISRMTVRRVISELAAAGMVYTVKGKGTFVAEPKLDEVAFSLNQRIEDLGYDRPMSTHLLECRIIKAEEPISTRLRIDKGTHCLFCRIVTRTGRIPLIYKTYYTIYTKKAPLIENQLRDMTLTRIASQHSENLPSRTKRILMASSARKDEAAVLDIEHNYPVFFMTETIYDQDNKVIAWGKSVFNGKHYRFVSYGGWNLDELKKSEEGLSDV
ncbi:MAG TPA: GntR family transcriptional regulator [Firmicutes bacterium]|jgi:GntR family transcriptional regulator|nr:GntR family transcriptional regulator [Bacillota bacterium]